MQESPPQCAGVGQGKAPRERLVAALAEAIVVAVETGEIEVAREVYEALGRVLVSGRAR